MYSKIHFFNIKYRITVLGHFVTKLIAAIKLGNRQTKVYNLATYNADRLNNFIIICV